MIIAIDGPAASGKGTLGRRIAKHFGLAYLDTGLLYRAVARDVLRDGLSVRNVEDSVAAAERLDPARLDDPQLRDPGIGEAASIVAGHGRVRQVLLEFQHRFSAMPPGAVLDGRDIGTVVCPHADAKLFVTATAHVRARRRYKEQCATAGIEGAGGEAGEAYEEVLDMIQRRDARDIKRASSPMRIANNAYLLETSDLSIDAAFDAAVAWIERKIGR